MTTRILLVLASASAARLAGFHGPANRHVADPNMHVLHPGISPESIRGMEFSHVIVDGTAVRTQHGRQMLEALDQAIRPCLRLPPMVWLEI